MNTVYIKTKMVKRTKTSDEQKQKQQPTKKAKKMFSVNDILVHTIELCKYIFIDEDNDYVNKFYNSFSDSGLFSETWKIYQENKDKMKAPGLDKDNYYFEVIDQQNTELHHFKRYACLILPSLINLLMLVQSEEKCKKLFLDYYGGLNENLKNKNDVLKLFSHFYKMGWQKKFEDDKNIQIKLDALYNHLK